MRQGSNPLKVRRAEAHLEKVFLTCVTHLPNMEDYHKQRLEVVKTCLTTMREGAHIPHTLMVWDNGSCADLRDWLQFEFKPDILILSANIGKTAARTSLVRMCDPRGVVAYSDDDIFFYDNWLAPQMDILDHFPNVASVTGYPVRTAFRWGVENTIKWARRNAKVEFGKFIPRAWEDDFAISVGRDPDWHAQYTAGDVDALITYKDKQAYGTSHHCQFIARVATIEKILQYDVWAMGDEKPFDIALDSIGLRLATTERLTRHIGNILDESFIKEAQNA